MKMTSRTSSVSTVFASFTKSLGLRIFAILLISGFALSSLQAQSVADWTGNKVLVDRTVAYTKLRQEANVIITAQANSEFRAATAQTMESVFYSRIAEEISYNNRSTKDAINTVANAMIAEGIDRDEIGRLVKKVIPLLS